MPHRSSLLKRLATAAAIGLVGASTALVATPAAATTNSWHPVRGGGYVALGDSFAAGEGLPRYERGTDTTTDQCHRSARKSYPELLERSRLSAFNQLHSVACSGAITASLFKRLPFANEPAQLNALHRNTKTVTLGIGGNDAGFSQVLSTCIHPAGVPTDASCRNLLNGPVTAQIANLASPTYNPTFAPTVPLPVVIAAIHAKAPRARIYVSSNPQLVGTTFTEPYGCLTGNLGPTPLAMAADDARLLREKAIDLATATATSVALARAAGIDAHFVDIGSRFDGHNLCDTKEPWLNPVSFTSVSPAEINPASVHPTARGQRTYAQAFASAAKAGGRAPNAVS